jgi:hypothetical protein
VAVSHGAPTGPLSNEAFAAGLRPIPTGSLPTPRRAPTDRITGQTPKGEPVEVALGGGGRFLLCFLATHCDGCDSFWRGLSGDGEDLPSDVSCVVVTKSSAKVDRHEVQRLSGTVGRWPVVMSDEAWELFGVFSYPFFVVLDAACGEVIGETVGFGWTEVHTMVSSPR